MNVFVFEFNARVYHVCIPPPLFPSLLYPCDACRTYSYIRLPCKSFMAWLSIEGPKEYAKAMSASGVDVSANGGGVSVPTSADGLNKRRRVPGEEEQDTEPEEGGDEEDEEEEEDARFVMAKKLRL